MLLSKLLSLLFFLISFALLRAQPGPVQTLFPAAIPLAVKTPYLNTWYDSLSNSDHLSNSWSLFWPMTTHVSWEGRIRVDGTTYQWMGADPAAMSGDATFTNVQITPTRSIFVMQAGPMNITITFLSPVEPDDWVKQSIPFSYMSVEVESLDGKSYPVQLYSDITAEWASGDRSSVVQWSNVNTGSSIYHKVQLQSPQQNVEIENQAQDGTTYYAMSTSQSGISWQIDLSDTVRAQFQTNGKLTNIASTAFGPIEPKYSVFAFAVDLRTIQSTASPVTWSIGYVRDPSVMYTTPYGAVQQRSPYYVTQYKGIDDVIDAFTGDYAEAHDRAIALDQKITTTAAKISSEYSDIVTLATRQTMSALDFTVSTDSNGNPVPEDVKIFMKNLGTDRRVNPVEHIYAAFPMFLFLNASIGGSLLQPLLEAQASLTGQSFAAMDIGNAYPSAPGPEAVPSRGVEQSGNMIIMELAYARISGDGALLWQYYNMTKRWADYLVRTALNSANQTNQDGDTTNLANTALKGILGVKAMSEIARALGEDSDALEYENKSYSLLNAWLSLATSSSGSHLLGGYGNEQSWSLMYNLFADKMLGLNFVPQSVVDMHTKYLSILLANASEWGLSIDSETQPSGNAAWTLFASAFVSDTTTRDSLIKSIHNHGNSNLSAGVFPEIYSTSDNSLTNGAAGPALGGVFSHLALTVANRTISRGAVNENTGNAGNAGNGSGNGNGNGNGNSSSRSSTNAGTIVGGVFGGLLVGIVVTMFAILLRVRIHKRRARTYGEANMTVEVPDNPTVTSHLTSTQALSDCVHVTVHSDTTAGFAGVGAGDMWVPCESHSAAISPTLNVSTRTACEATPTTTTHLPTPSDSMVTSTSSNVVSPAESGLSGDPLLSRLSISATDVMALWTEVENLRQVMQDHIRAEQLEAPPEYTE